MDSLAQIILAFFVGLGIFIGLLGWASQFDQKRDTLSECIWNHMEEDHFPGDLKQGWETYYSVCK